MISAHTEIFHYLYTYIHTYICDAEIKTVHLHYRLKITNSGLIIFIRCSKVVTWKLGEVRI